jgi:predicted P-loop ATPase
MTLICKVLSGTTFSRAYRHCEAPLVEQADRTLNDTDLNYLMLYLEDKYGLTSEKKIRKQFSIVADCNQYHPIRDYLNSLEWDGTERIRYALTRFLGAEDRRVHLSMLATVHAGSNQQSVQARMQI